MRNEWEMQRLFVSELLLSLHWDFSGGIPKLVVTYAPAWQVPKCCHFLGILSTSGDIRAVDVAHNVSGYGWTPLCTLPFLQLVQGVVANSLILARMFQCMG